MASLQQLQQQYDDAAAAWGRAVRDNPGNSRSFTRRMNRARDALHLARHQVSA